MEKKENQKRKTKTSTAVKQRYLDKAYDQISFRAKKGTKEEIQAAAKEAGVSMARYILLAVEAYKKNSK